MKIINRLFDVSLNAMNVMLVMNIKEYVLLTKNISFLRPKLQTRDYNFFKENLKNGYLCRPIILSVDKIIKDLEDLSYNKILSIIKKSDNLFILDGLIRTFILSELENDLKKQNIDSLANLYKPIRVEIYFGLTKIGMLYKSTSFYSGSSLKNRIKNLYSNYTIKEKGFDIYKIDDLINGFHTYITRDEFSIYDSCDVIQVVVQELINLSKENLSLDVFEKFITSYHSFVQSLCATTGYDCCDWKINNSEKVNKIFGITCEDFFTNGITISAYGAAIGKLKDKGVIKDFDDVMSFVPQLKFDEGSNSAIYNLLKNLTHITNNVNNKNEKIIIRNCHYYLTCFFNELFNSSSKYSNGKSFLIINRAIDTGFRKYVCELE